MTKDELLPLLREHLKLELRAEGGPFWFWAYSPRLLVTIKFDDEVVTEADVFLPEPDNR